MVALTRKPQPDPEAMYEPVVPFSGPHGLFNPQTKVRGDHVAVRANLGQWMLADLPDDEKAKLRAAAMWSHTTAELPKAAPDPVARRPSGRFRAVRSWTLADPDLAHRGRINAGELVDASDEVYRQFPHLFVKEIEER